MAPVLRVTGSLAVLLFGSALTASPRQISSGQAPTPAPTGFILGRAVDGTTGKALAGAMVSLNSSATAAVPGAAPRPSSLRQENG